jgi:hypothetical protein
MAQFREQFKPSSNLCHHLIATQHTLRLGFDLHSVKHCLSSDFKMARQRKEPSIKLRQPDRSGPSEKTLLDLAQERNLFEQAKQREQENAATNRSKRADKKAGPKVDDDDVPEPAVLSPGAERLLESVLWVSTLSMLYFTLYVLVQNQYAVTIKWDQIVTRTAISWPSKLILFPHRQNTPLTTSHQSSSCSSTLFILTPTRLL